MVLKPRRVFRASVSIGAPALLWVLLHGCASHQRTGDETPPAGEEPTSKTSARLQGKAAESPPIRNQGVGELVVGQALPRSLLAAESSAYYSGFYSDAQPLEGFNIAEPPVLAILRDGPFHAYGMQHPGESPPAELRAETLDLAQKGKLVVDMIVVTSPKLRTERGVHVGTKMADVRAAYPDAESLNLPALWEEPTCIVQAQNLWFFFDRCSSEGPTADAEVIRIVVREAGT